MWSAQAVATSSQSSYQASLSEAWAQHLAPRAPNAPTVISTFAGAGGSSLGYSMAGFRELLAVEWDPNAVATFKLNFPDVPVYHGDVAKLSVEDVLARTGLQPGQLDVFDGSPPCQGFSTAGKRDMGDNRNQLFREYVRLLRGLKPKAFVMENVSGMVKGKMKLIFVEILKELKASGYKVSARLLNAMYFGVPQSRQRMIFIGVRDDVGKAPSHPAAETRPIAVREAWKGVVIDRSGCELTPLYQKYWRMAGQGGSVGALKSTKRLRIDSPSPTITKSEGNGGLYHPTEMRALCHAEFKRLGSWPDGFTFTGTKKDKQERIGNSVPPLFMRAIAKHVREAILHV
jgi:DNA (cytosine-5)-methyltransferase 1